MKSFLVACVAIVVIAVGASYVLARYQEPVSEAYSSPSSVRI
jgi:hypothetical protein